MRLHTHAQFLLAHITVCENKEERWSILQQLRLLIDDIDDEVQSALPELLGADSNFLGQLDHLT
jgi:hypothetical protein